MLRLVLATLTLSVAADARTQPFVFGPDLPPFAPEDDPVRDQFFGKDVLVGDVDGDGDNDVVSINLRHGVGVRLNRGDGAFDPPIVTPLEASPFKSQPILRLGDLDGDGLAEILFSNESTALNAMSNLGGGAFAAPDRIGEITNFAPDFRLADLDGDGDLDIVRRAPDETLLNDGTGRFSRGQSLAFDVLLTELAVADFNNDGAPDLAALNGNGSSPTIGLQIALNDGQGALTVDPIVQFEGSASPLRFALSLAAGDLDGDGDADLAVGAIGTEFFPAGAIVLHNDGSGRFVVAQEIDIDAEPSELALADFDGDGALDLAGAARFDDGPLTVLLNDGGGRFDRTLALAPGLGPSVDAGDLDGDGRPDIVVIFRTLLNDLDANPADLDGDGAVASSDLGLLIAAWGSDGPADLDGDGVVGSGDLGVLLAAWTGA